MNESKFIGLTGGIGSGKSKVSRFWASYGAVQLIDIDQICRELVEVEEPGWLALKQNLADTFFKRNGDLDRQALRSAIFNNDALRNQVNQLIHPLALDQLKSRTAAIGHPVLVEVPLLFEAGWEKYFTSIVVVYADQQTCCRRIAARDGVSPQEAAHFGGYSGKYRTAR